MRILALLFPFNLLSLNLYQLHLYIVKGVNYILSCRDAKIFWFIDWFYKLISKHIDTFSIL